MGKESKSGKKRTVMKVLLTTIVVMLCAAFPVIHFVLKFPELGQNPAIGKWYKVSGEGMMSSDGSDWHGFFKIGSENKVLVYFQGGGVSVDEHTASTTGFFIKKQSWMDRINNKITDSGIGSKNEDNPFCGWTVIMVPYSTGDFHSGEGEYTYTDEMGEKQVLHYNGYVNYSALMKKVMPYIETPDALVVAGFSAGGFGASLLADDISSHYFPDVTNKTVLVDSALLLYDKWHETAENTWNVPEEIVERITTNNITLDSLAALHEKYGDEIKILFDCSVRDGELAKYQSYLSGGPFEAGEDGGDAVQENLKNMVKMLLEKCDAGIYIWNDFGYNGDGSNLTQHAIINVPDFYLEKLDEGPAVADWVMDAVNGEINSYGAELLQISEL